MVSMITEDGGEGVIIRKLHSCYENGRGTHLLKIKVSIFFLYSSMLYYNTL
jgi:ATP-dependent DNA ligase